MICGAILDLLTEDGRMVHQFVLDREVLDIEWSLSTNDIGAMVVDINPCSDVRRLIKPFMRVNLWLVDELGGKWLEGETTWFILGIRDRVGVDPFWRFTAYTANMLLNRRSIPWPADSPQASKDMIADGMLVEIFDEAYGAPASAAYSGAGRDRSPWVGFQPSPSAAPQVQKQFSWRPTILSVMQEIAEDSRALGTPLFFDIVVEQPSQYLRYTTYTGARGRDLTVPGANYLPLGVKEGTLEYSELNRDYSDERSVSYAAGRGEKEDRQWDVHIDTQRVNAHLFGRSENVTDARNVDKTEYLIDEARADVELHRPLQKIEAKLSSSVCYGREVRWGDKVPANHEGILYTSEISNVHGIIRANRITVDVYLRSHEPLIEVENG